MTMELHDHLHGHAHSHDHVHASPRFDIRHYLPSVLLAGYGILIISLYLRGVLIWYINPSYVLPAMLAAGVLIVLAGVLALRKPAVHCDTCCEDGCDCSSSLGSYRVYGMLAIPLLLALLVPPHALAGFSAIQRGPQVAGVGVIRGASAVKRVSLSVNTRSFTMQDWVGALSADPNPADYTGKPVVVTGLVVHDPSSTPKGYFMVIRYLVTCCIADARPVGLIVKDTSNGALKDNQWVTVTGSMGAAEDGGQKVAVVLPKSLTPIKAGNPYIY
jgi:uncharacterized repeat protein (TIGR03943 family)